MATTRRQSARLAQQGEPNGSREQPVVVDEEEDEEFFSSESEGMEDADSRRPARRKRPRTAANNGTPRRARAAANGSRRVVEQFKFLELNEAVRDQVLAFLEPRDLLRLAWASSSMAKILMSRVRAPIWAFARKNTVLPGGISIPECPDDISELRWAHLLFGPTQCFTCGAPNINTIIFPFRRRACVTCMKANMLFEKKFPAQFKDQSDAILKLLPHSNTGPWAHGRSSNSKFYWTPDVEKAIARHVELTKDVTDGKPDALANLKRWKADRMLEADSIVLESKEHDCWIERRDKGRDNAGDDARLQRKLLVEARLLEEGWDMDDITKLAFMPKTTPAKPDLTAAAWTRIRKEVEPTLLALRSRRLFEGKLVALGFSREDVLAYRCQPHYEGESIASEEWDYTWENHGPQFLRIRSKELFEAKLAELGWGKKAIASIQYSPSYAGLEITDEEWEDTCSEIAPQIRKLKYRSLGSKLLNVYAEYCDSLPPTRWRTLPTVEDVSKLPAVLSVLSSRGAAWQPVRAEDLAKVAEQLPQLVDAWLAKAKARLADGVFLPSVDPDGQAVLFEAQPEHLDLAIAVFTCETSWASCSTAVQRMENVLLHQQSIPFIGLEEALAHERLHAGTYEVEFDRSAARPPSKRLSMDPQKARPRDVDLRDARFRCAHCAALHPYTLGRVVMDWRRSVAHFAASAEKDHAHPCWIMLTPEETDRARDLVRRSVCGASTAHQWVCNRCDFEHEHVQAVIVHLIQRHGTSNVVTNEDYMSASSCLIPMAPVTLDKAPTGAVPANRAPPAAPLRSLPLASDPRDPLSLPPRPVTLATRPLTMLARPIVVPIRPVAAPTQTQATTTNYMCVHCGGHRKFQLGGVTQHIQAKHKILQPADGKDYRLQS
ncbi:hypothetical protein AURDEDRAFT_184503 [Auricularia subglabra TFB-10046 SS5]|nr:hypothetical protein AURDEDRAFT_184503 [Auricularia subglabra TFB-10046 SS5]